MKYHIIYLFKILFQKKKKMLTQYKINNNKKKSDENRVYVSLHSVVSPAPTPAAMSYCCIYAKCIHLQTTDTLQL